MKAKNLVNLMISVGAAGATSLDCSFTPKNDQFQFLNGITTATPSADTLFQQGVYHMWGFNQPEAMNMFDCCVAADPSAAMCQWGRAYAAGPFLNKPFSSDEELQLAQAAVTQARKLADASATITDAEMNLISAFELRFPSGSNDQTAGALDYRDYLRTLITASSYSSDADLLSMYGEAEMNAMRSQGLDYYEDSLQLGHGAPREGSVNCMKALETAMDLTQYTHPLALHFYIHITEPLTPMSSLSDAPLNDDDARKGEAAGAALAALNFTGFGHFEHMPSHLFLRVGRYADVVSSNVLAHTADDIYDIYDRMPYGPAHNTYFLVVGAALDGQSAVAVEYAQIVRKLYMNDVDDGSPGEEAGWNVLMQIYVRFGMWQEVLNDTIWDNGKENYATFVGCYCRAVAFFKLDDAESGQKEYDRLMNIVNKGYIDDSLYGTRVAVATHTLAALFNDSIEDMVAAADEQNGWGYNSPPLWSQLLTSSMAGDTNPHNFGNIPATSDL
jgi:hypothetical protein